MLRALILAMFLAACTSLQPLSPDTVIGGERLAGRAIILKAGFSYRPKFQTVWFPVGPYLPDFEDKEQVYFKAETSLIMQTILDGRMPLTGGLTINKIGAPKLRSYIVIGGDIHVVDIPFEVSYSLVSR